MSPRRLLPRIDPHFVRLTTSTTKCEDNDKRLCGKWCGKVSPETPCWIDTHQVPCHGSHCQTTAGLWKQFVLNGYRTVSCDQYKNGIAYPAKAVPCAPSCLIPEVSSERYPAPTGLGVFCRPNSCFPGASPDHDPASGLGVLQCPCNWFMSQCRDGMVAVKQVESQAIGNHLVQVKLYSSQNRKLLQEARSGSVLRIRHQHGENLCEMSGVLARQTADYLEVLVAPPDRSLDPSVRHVAEYLRQYGKQSTCWTPKELFVHPVISGFFNSQYEFLDDYLADDDDDTVVLVATGAGIAGFLSVLERHPHRRFRLYYGVRGNVVPYQELLEQCNVDLVVVGSSLPSGEYVQDVVRRDVARMARTPVIVVCGRLEVMKAMEEIGEQRRVFRNI